MLGWKGNVCRQTAIVICSNEVLSNAVQTTTVATHSDCSGVIANIVTFSALRARRKVYWLTTIIKKSIKIHGPLIFACTNVLILHI